MRDRQAQYRIDLRLKKLQLGNLGDCRFVGEGVYELKIDYGPGYCMDEVLSKTGQEAIYSLGFWLKSLGLKLSVNVYQLNPSKLDSETPVLQELLSNPKKE